MWYLIDLITYCTNTKCYIVYYVVNISHEDVEYSWKYTYSCETFVELSLQSDFFYLSTISRLSLQPKHQKWSEFIFCAQKVTNVSFSRKYYRIICSIKLIFLFSKNTHFYKTRVDITLQTNQTATTDQQSYSSTCDFYV